MRQPNPVQPMQPLIQQFSQQQRQPLQPALGPPPAGAEQAIQQQMHELALEIYARAAADDLLDADYDQLRTLAAGSQRAARAFFEAMGVQFNDQA